MKQKTNSKDLENLSDALTRKFFISLGYLLSVTVCWGVVMQHPLPQWIYILVTIFILGLSSITSALAFKLMTTLCRIIFAAEYTDNKVTDRK